MRKITLVASFIMAVAVVGLLTNCKSKSSDTASKESNESKTNIQLSSTFSAAWVNIDTLINNYDMYFDMQKVLEESGRKSEAELSTKSRDFEREAGDFQNKVQKGLVTRSQAEQLQQVLAGKEQELYRLRDELRARLAEEQQVKLRQIQQSINDYLVEYNKEKGYHIILSSTFGGPLLYGHPALDITQEVMKGLNEKYISERKDK
ncbi:MAG: OmpH family outer membrane protein [Bacteroidales bacterium]|nr:MAG: OmpH family outer membrane protein [Bacteroidales bacterium]